MLDYLKNYGLFVTSLIFDLNSSQFLMGLQQLNEVEVHSLTMMNHASIASCKYYH